MINPSEIKAKMAVVCSSHGHLGFVDRMEDPYTIRLAKDNQGKHHYVPIAWVRSVAAEVQLDRTVEDAKREWSTNPPALGLRT